MTTSYALAFLAVKLFSSLANSMQDERTSSGITWLNSPLRNRQSVEMRMLKIGQCLHRDVNLASAALKDVIPRDTKSSGNHRPSVVIAGMLALEIPEEQSGGTQDNGGFDWDSL
ncbi:hypothetical protein WG66_006338 [Moniliophthora roreri]|nr:hypothetical protein WG66_006338 [Moniliophthora roreri]